MINTNLALGLIIVVLVVLEWEYRKAKYGFRRATIEILGAALVFGIGLEAYNRFELIGLLGVLVVLMGITIVVILKRKPKYPLVGEEVVLRWMDLKNVKTTMFISTRFERFGRIFYTEPELGVLHVTETRDGYKLTHTALNAPVMAPALYYEHTTKGSGIRLYKPIHAPKS